MKKSKQDKDLENKKNNKQDKILETKKNNKQDKIPENKNNGKSTKMIEDKKNSNKGKKGNKILKVTFIICGAIIVIELIAMLIMYLVNERKINYLDTINNLELVDNEYYLGAGSSNFRHSKYNDMKVYRHYTDEIDVGYEKIVSEQAKLVKYDLSMNILWEKTFDAEYDATYYDVLKVDDGIIAVGSYVSKASQLDLKTRDGLLVKYDDDGNYQWSKNYQVLGDTEFYRVIDVDDGIIAIGQSIYENMEIGNHDMGGGIIVKFDYDGNVLWKNNYGGNKSGSFNDIVVLNDGYILCGKDGANYGMIVKFSLEGNRLWNYSTLDVAVTDTAGFNRMKLYDNKLYIASSVNTSDEKDAEGNAIYSFDASVYVYDLNGKYVSKYKYGGNSDERFNDLFVDDSGIIAVGHTLSTDLFEDSNIDNQTGIIVKFSFDKEVIHEEYYGGANYDVLSTVILDENNNYLIAGYSNSFGNKKDFTPQYKKIVQ